MIERPVYFDNIHELINDLELSAKDSRSVFNYLSRAFDNQKMIKYYFIIDEERRANYIATCSENSIRLWRYFNEYLKEITGYNDDEYGLDYVIIEK